MRVSLSKYQKPSNTFMLLLLAIIYLAFISLGLPDAVLGSAWPIMNQDLNSTLEFAGVIAVVISMGTVVSSLLASRIIYRFGIGKVVALSVLMTAGALLGFSAAHHVLALVLLAIPLGIGAGAVDAALNNFVALHYQSKHMNYLHSFWGVGATAGPLLMATYLSTHEGWRDGYTTLAIIQFALVTLLFLTLPLWKKAVAPMTSKRQHDDQQQFVSNMDALKIPGVKLQLFIFACYCSLEAGTGLWAASYLNIDRGVTATDAAFWTAMFFLGITAGRFICGAIAERASEVVLIRIGSMIILAGVVGLIAPLPVIVTQLSLVLIGLGCAPIYPNTIQLTPRRFGRQASPTIIGLSMATAYTGMTLVPFLIGVVVSSYSFSYFPIILIVISLTMLVMTERLASLSTQTSVIDSLKQAQ